MDHGRRPLCESCRCATVIRGARLADQIVECNQLSFFSRRVTFPVTSCSDYISRNQADLEEMEEIALMLKTEPRRAQVGFGQNNGSPNDEGERSED